MLRVQRAIIICIHFGTMGRCRGVSYAILKIRVTSSGSNVIGEIGASYLFLFSFFKLQCVFLKLCSLGYKNDEKFHNFPEKKEFIQNTIFFCKG